MQYHMNIDLETFSSVDLRKSGLYAYTRSPDFSILLFAYSVNNSPVIVIDLAQGGELPEGIIQALSDPNYIKHAYNASFEWACLSRALGRELPVEQWRDTMLHAMYSGYPAGLEATGRAMGLPEDKQKLTTGRALIRYFCVPCKPTKTNGGRTRNLPQHDPDKWGAFIEYNRQDVVTEMTICNRLRHVVVPDAVQKQWETDLRINSRGVAVDMDFVHGALDLGSQIREALMTEAVRLTGLRNPNSVAQLSNWLEEATGTSVTDLRKSTVTAMLEQMDCGPGVQRMLEIRQELGKTSTKKYDAIEAAVCDDGRVRGLLQFYGANRTGRWAGRLVQVQNLPRTYTEPLDLARELVKGRKLDALRLIYGSPNDTLSQLIRTAFVASPGKVLIDADFSAIEARVISWLANEEWRLDVFRTHGKIYEASASRMFGVPINRIVKGNPEYALRQRGKVAELALGYQGGVGAMRAMDTGGLLSEMSDDEVYELVRQWRDTNPKIRTLWYDFESAATMSIGAGNIVTTHRCTFFRTYDKDGHTYLCIGLPSGRTLYYVDPSYEEYKGRISALTYHGLDQTTKKWTKLETYGGKIVENVVQAIARDCLAQAIEALEAAGFSIVFHVHDEVVIEAEPFDTEENMLARVVAIMSAPISWAPGLPLRADGWVGTYFKKD